MKTPIIPCIYTISQRALGKHRQTRQNQPRRAPTSVPIHGLAETGVTMRTVSRFFFIFPVCGRGPPLARGPRDEEPRVSNTWCRNPATCTVSAPGCIIANQPRRHKLCPCSERTCKVWRGGDGVTETLRPYGRMKTRDRMAVDVARPQVRVSEAVLGREQGGRGANDDFTEAWRNRALLPSQAPRPRLHRADGPGSISSDSRSFSLLDVGAASTGSCGAQRPSYTAYQGRCSGKQGSTAPAGPASVSGQRSHTPRQGGYTWPEPDATVVHSEEAEEAPTFPSPVSSSTAPTLSRPDATWEFSGFRSAAVSVVCCPESRDYQSSQSRGFRTRPESSDVRGMPRSFDVSRPRRRSADR
ncbi:hypothetical protein CPLU01_05644 [Colletotrichum plurivorum]|uniref:Uncharacterized protein n=1 Tax=Colletotrichum plurivorum TaxID=2175906 RepID=A0A8H6KL64_9PEZI|nr:hypothetical protein CPLU01_05644 [Colletotrichum plurivorum]